MGNLVLGREEESRQCLPVKLAPAECLPHRQTQDVAMLRQQTPFKHISTAGAHHQSTDSATSLTSDCMLVLDSKAILPAMLQL